MAHMEIRFSGSGGQGLLLSARILAAALARQGRHVAQSNAYEPVSRGGLSRSDLVISDGEAAFPLARRVDYLLILDAAAATVSTHLLHQGAVVLADAERVPDPPRGDFRTIALPFTETARGLGNPRVTNIVALGALCTLAAPCPAEALLDALLAMTPARFERLNRDAFAAGLAMAVQEPA
ncbi:2-oxoacid:acceptor oxidoreductase family protein [Rhodovulum euryhalinum]|uniref:2-oxoglutarate ferredoxin oxidoreductase subunit gamma n=1 Tax=Rhodovulum euryhalinum TaxID=35805 RepID=A0A4R2KQB7_9RHOB|nr:2-oxoacid:acceptor oxidoreductase family protein [Rhodovulum euryhalinum]TCO72318.1 2-oxoglutarate ferredoxin oxidoreductase subunit gamma [Rhodovulum euryhalinum]